MSTVYLKEGDTAPAATATLKDAVGSVVDLTDASVRFLLRDMVTGLSLLEATADVDADPTTGKCSYPWQAGDTDVPGAYRGEFEVTFDGGEIESFPDGGYVNVVILRKSAALAS